MFLDISWRPMLATSTCIWQFPRNTSCPARVHIGACSLLPCHRLDPPLLRWWSGNERWPLKCHETRLRWRRRPVQRRPRRLDNQPSEICWRGRNNVAAHILVETKIQHVGSESSPAPIAIANLTVDVTDKFTYLGSDIGCSGYCSADTLAAGPRLIHHGTVRLSLEKWEAKHTDIDTYLLYMPSPGPA